MKFRIRIVATDLQHDGNSWRENGSIRDEVVIELKGIPQDYTERFFSKLILATMRKRVPDFFSVGVWDRDDWSGAAFSWRRGHLGIYAEYESVD